MGQYGPEEELYNSDLSQFKEGKYSKAIGNFILSFSSLENSLNNYLAAAINERSYEPGYRIIKYLNFKTKINILNDEGVFFIKIIVGSKKKQEKLLEELKIIYSKLKELSQFRNKVAHADWTSLDKKGFVITKIKEDEQNGGVYFQKTKMTPGVILKFTRQNMAVRDRLSIFRDKIWETNRLEEIKRQKIRK